MLSCSHFNILGHSISPIFKSNSYEYISLKSKSSFSLFVDIVVRAFYFKICTKNTYVHTDSASGWDSCVPRSTYVSWLIRVVIKLPDHTMAPSFFSLVPHLLGTNSLFTSTVQHMIDSFSRYTWLDEQTDRLVYWDKKSRSLRFYQWKNETALKCIHN